MSYQQGYRQQPTGMYEGGYPADAGGPNPAMTIIAAVLGLVAAASLVVLDVHFFAEEIPEGLSFADAPGEWKTIVILRAAAALILLTGLILMLVRKLAGAILLIMGALAGLAAILLVPVLLKDTFQQFNVDFGEYLKGLFEFNNTEQTFAAITLIAAPLALIAAILPPTLNYLRGPGGGDDFPQYPQETYQQQGYPQQQQGYPQQDYPQQGYPQQPNW